MRIKKEKEFAAHASFILCRCIHVSVVHKTRKLEQLSPKWFGLIFAGYVPLASQSPYHTIVYPVASYRPHHIVTFGQLCNFRDPNLVTIYIYICIYVTFRNEGHFTFHLQYKHSGTFANRKYEKLAYPKNQKMCDPILVTPSKMRPDFSQSCSENETPSSGTSPLASYKEVLPPLPHWVHA